MDVIKKRGDRIDVKKLSAELGCEVVETSALKETGLDEVVAAAKKLATAHKEYKPEKKFSDEIYAQIKAVNTAPAAIETADA